MSEWSEYIRTLLLSESVQRSENHETRVGAFGDVAREYHVLQQGVALTDRSDRALLEVRGADRAAWLHNLTTNAVRTLETGDGCYSFVTNASGRILFDADVNMRADSIWISLDHRAITRARDHFNKYIVVEDVAVVDRTSEFVRLGLVGSRVKEVLADLGISQAASLPRHGLAEYTIDGARVAVMRNDLSGMFGFELFIPRARAVIFWKALSDARRPVPAIPVGDAALEIRRIESGWPLYPYEINDNFLPAETRQTDRAVSYSKGCYLGQEVIERMRSRDVVARQLVGLVVEGDMPASATQLTDRTGEEIGVLTSRCRSIALKKVIGLGYVRAGLSSAGTMLTMHGPGGAVGVTVADLPFTESRSEARA